MLATDRRTVLKWILAMSSASALPPSVARAATDWQEPMAETTELLPGVKDRIENLSASGKLAGVHGIVAVRHEQIVFERYMKGSDAAWGRALGEVDFGPNTLHDLRSVTKSIVGLLYGIALAKGQVPGVDAPLSTQFPEYPELWRNPERSRLTIGQALSMTLAMQWNENVPYTDSQNSEIAMESAIDRYHYILTRPVLGEPGKGWIYSGGDVALLGRIIEKGSRMALADFAKETLFSPLDIRSFEWAKGKDGEASAASGLRLRPRDLAKIGQLILNRGRWNGAIVVPEAWLTSSFKPRALVDIGWPGMHYGYLWFVGETAMHGTTGTYGEEFVAAFGNGGQRLFVFPGLDFILCVTTGNYDLPDQWRAPAAILFDAFLPTLTS